MVYFDPSQLETMRLVQVAGALYYLLRGQINESLFSVARIYKHLLPRLKGRMSRECSRTYLMRQIELTSVFRRTPCQLAVQHWTCYSDERTVSSCGIILQQILTGQSAIPESSTESVTSDIPVQL
jgi:hypothetical protein